MNAVTEGWAHKDEWKKYGRDFCITITRHTFESDLSRCEGPHRWCVYAYIYPNHAHFSKFEGPDHWQPASEEMPLHGGSSFLRYPMEDGEITSVQVGADYNHLGDDEFTQYATQAEAYEVFHDAENLHIWLTVRAEIQVPA